jgi:antitoxin component of MazEF toxin-antitoxin module
VIKLIEVDAVARKWGNSIGIALPREVVEQANIEPNTEVKIFIRDRNIDLSKVFGTLHTSKTAQEMLDDARRGER